MGGKILGVGKSGSVSDWIGDFMGLYSLCTHVPCHALKICGL